MQALGYGFPRRPLLGSWANSRLAPVLWVEPMRSTMIAGQGQTLKGFDLARFLNGSSQLGTRRWPRTPPVPPYGSKPAVYGSLVSVRPRNFFERERRLVLSMSASTICTAPKSRWPPRPGTPAQGKRALAETSDLNVKVPKKAWGSPTLLIAPQKGPVTNGRARDPVRASNLAKTRACARGGTVCSAPFPLPLTDLERGCGRLPLHSTSDKAL
jgi:hypothetical protein